MMVRAIPVLDEFFSRYLECDLTKVATGRVWVIPSDRRDLPEPNQSNIFALWLIASGNRCVISVQRNLEETVRRVVGRLRLGDFRTAAGQRALYQAVAARLGGAQRTSFSSGPILFATSATLRPIPAPNCRPVTAADIPQLSAVGLYGPYLDRSIAEGTCFAAFDGEQPVAVAGTWEVPHLAAQVAEMCVPGTVTARRREGFGKRVLACATAAVLRTGRIPVYTTSDLNLASIALARAVGYQPYGWQFRVEVICASGTSALGQSPTPEKRI